MEAKCNGKARKASVTYFGGFNENHKDVAKARQKVNEAIGKLVDVCSERRIAAKQNNEKDISLVRDLRKKLKALEKERENMDADEYIAKVAAITQKLVLGLDGKDKEEASEDDQDDGSDDNDAQMNE